MLGFVKTQDLLLTPNQPMGQWDSPTPTPDVIDTDKPEAKENQRSLRQDWAIVLDFFKYKSEVGEGGRANLLTINSGQDAMIFPPIGKKKIEDVLVETRSRQCYKMR